MKLFVFYIGGDAPGSNIELHDLRIIAAPSMMDCIPEIKKQWWGIPGSLHLDCWGELHHADGFDIHLRPEPFNGPEKLWFLNLGGYLPHAFSELHKNVFVVAEREVQARAKALKQILDWDGHHKDYQYEVEKVIAVGDSIRPMGLHLHLTPNPNPPPFVFGTGYKPIGKPDYELTLEIPT
jgi:hypothetical protein